MLLFGAELLADTVRCGKTWAEFYASVRPEPSSHIAPTRMSARFKSTPHSVTDQGA